MKELFDCIWKMSLISCYVIIIVLILRLLLKKMPKIFSYALWGVVFFRLVCPVLPGSAFSLIPRQLEDKSMRTYEMTQNQASSTMPPMEAGTAAYDTGKTANSLMPSLPDDGILRTQEVPLKPGLTERIVSVLPYIWITGVLILLLVNIISLVRLRRRVSGAWAVEAGVYETNAVNVSFVMGLVRPKIYIYEGLTEQNREYVLCHERVHISRKDYLVKMLALFITLLHWFNPLVWLSFKLMGNDMEMACDEKVVKILGTNVKREYSYALLDAAEVDERTHRSRFLSCSFISLGENHVKARVRNILHYKRPVIWISTAAVLLLLAVCLGLLLNPVNQVGDEDYTNSILRAGSYPEGTESFCYADDYDGDGRREAFVVTGTLEEGSMDGDIWFVSSGLEAVKLQEQIRFTEDQAGLYETGKKKYILLSYTSGNPLLTSMYGVEEGRAVPVLPFGESKYIDGDRIACVQSSYDMMYDRELQQTVGHTWKPYYFRYEDGSFLPYAARDAKRQELLQYENGEEILTGLDQEHPGAVYQYLVREDGEWNINIAAGDETSIAFYYKTYLAEEDSLVLKEEGDGYYLKDLTAADQTTFLQQILEQDTGGEENSSTDTVNYTEEQKYASKIIDCISRDDKGGFAALIAYPVRVYIGSEQVSIQNAAEFEEKYDKIVNPSFKKLVMGTDMNDLFTNYMGTMLGLGQIWFSEIGGKEGFWIYAVNNEWDEEDVKRVEQSEAWIKMAKERGMTGENEAVEWYARFREDGIKFQDGYKIADTAIGDLDRNGRLDVMLLTVPDSTSPMIQEEDESLSWLYLYMDGGEVYTYCIPDVFPYLGFESAPLSGDIDNDGFTEIVYNINTGGNGGMGSSIKGVLKYEDGTVREMKLPGDPASVIGDLEYGYQVNVLFGQRENEYVTECPSINRTASLKAPNAVYENGGKFIPNWTEGDAAGGNSRGYCNFEIVERDGREYLKAREYLFGEGGISHGIGMAVFLLDWKTDGTPWVVEYSAEGFEETQ